MRPGVDEADAHGVAGRHEEDVSLLGLAADEDPWFGLLGVRELRRAAEVLEAYQVHRARQIGWTWAQIAVALKVSPQAVHRKHARNQGRSG